MENKLKEIEKLEDKLRKEIKLQYEECNKVEMAGNFHDFFLDMLYSRGIKEKLISLLKIAIEEEMNLFDYLVEELHSFNTDRDFNTYQIFEDYINTILERSEYVELHSQTLKELWNYGNKR